MVNLRPRTLLRLASALGLVLAISAPATADNPAAGHGSKSARFDAAVQDWNDHGNGPDRQRVIVRMVPGTRGAAVRALRAGGLNVKAEHPLIDAATLEVPRSALDGLAHNPNILSISSDAGIGAHVTVAPSGATLRSALGVTSLHHDEHDQRAQGQRCRRRHHRLGHHAFERLRQPHRGLLRRDERRLRSRRRRAISTGMARTWPA